MDSTAVGGGIPPESEQAQKMNFIQRLLGVFFEPRRTFEDIDRHGSWLPMFIVAMALGLAGMYILTTRMDSETYMRKAIEMSPFARNLTEEQIQAAIQRPQGAFGRYSQFVFAPLGGLVLYAICAGVLLLVFVIMGAHLTFKKSFALTVWGMAPPGLIMGLLSILFLFIKSPQDLELDPSRNVVSNLGVLVSSKSQPVLHSLLGSIDLFSFWVIFLLAVGFSVASRGKLSTGKAAVGVIIPWAIYVLGKAGFAAIF